MDLLAGDRHLTEWDLGMGSKALKALMNALYDQGMIPEKIKLDDFFTPVRGQCWKAGRGTTRVTP